MNIRPLTSLYSPRYPAVLVYMLQATEYQSKPYLKWLWRTRDFSRVQHRRKLDRTNKAKLLLIFLSAGMVLEAAAGVILIMLGILNNVVWGWEIGTALLIAYPFVWSHLAIVPLELGRMLVVEPSQNKQIAQSSELFAKHPGVKIAVAGSYGKTTMKELLFAVLSEGKKVAATAGNKNVAIEHAKFANRLKGDEEVLIIEYGEGAPGDVLKFTQTTQPTHAVITGLAPAHLDKYKTIEAAGEDIFSLGDYLGSKNVYVNGESEFAKPFIKPAYMVFSYQGVGEWKVSDVQVAIEGLSFKLSNGKQTLAITSKLLGSHQIGPLSAAAVLALDLGLNKAQVEAGIAKAQPFEHRMQPYALGGAWIIDDTYNGNIDGIKAGTALLKELQAKRKIYVTPGLVDQGNETERVHLEMGRLIASAKPDLVVLMKNSVVGFIKGGLDQAKYAGELQIIDDPLEFYTSIEHLVAAGDLVLMQNDWTDNYF